MRRLIRFFTSKAFSFVMVKKCSFFNQCNTFCFDGKDSGYLLVLWLSFCFYRKIIPLWLPLFLLYQQASRVHSPWHLVLLGNSDTLKLLSSALFIFKSYFFNFPMVVLCPTRSRVDCIFLLWVALGHSEVFYLYFIISILPPPLLKTSFVYRLLTWFCWTHHLFSYL